MFLKAPMDYTSMVRCLIEALRTHADKRYISVIVIVMLLEKILLKSIVWGHTIKNLKHHKSFLFVSPIFKISPTKLLNNSVVGIR